MNIKKYIQITLFIITTSASIDGFWPFDNISPEQNPESRFNQASDKDNTHWLQNLKTPGSQRLQQPTTPQELEFLEELENEKMQKYQEFLQNPIMHKIIIQELKQYQWNIQELTTMFEMFSKLEKAFQPNASQKNLEEGFAAFQDFLKLSSKLQQQQEAAQRDFIADIQPDLLEKIQNFQKSDKRKENLLNSDKPNLLKGITALSNKSKMPWLR